MHMHTHVNTQKCRAHTSECLRHNRLCTYYPCIVFINILWLVAGAIFSASNAALMLAQMGDIEGAKKEVKEWKKKRDS